MNKLGRLFCSALVALSIFGAASCDSKTNSSNPSSLAEEENSFTQDSTSGSLGMFSLSSPSLGASLKDASVFSWTEAANAAYYTLEIASTEKFISNDNSLVYYKHDYIAATSFKIDANLSQKDITYYWRVTAHAGGKNILCNNVFHFFLESVAYDEVAFPLGEVSDWSIHQQGNPVQLSLDNTDFFSNDQPSLAIKFQMEQTKGIGWSVITKTVEKDTYGTDSLYFRFFYSGMDAIAFIRLRDNDGEFWRHKIQLSNNSKQICIMPFSEFTQDTELVTVANHTFDYFHIKYMEVVFEQTWGDGICLVSQIKTIKKANYASLFINKLNFHDYPTENWTWENGFNFGFDISEDGYSYTLNYLDGMPGYAFAKIPANRFFDDGDMVKMEVKYSGQTGGNMTFRLKEEDGDYWYYMQPFSTLSSEDFTTVYIPFESFGSTYLGGNGRREFSWISQLQFGLTNMYGKGTLTYRNVEIVSRADESAINTGKRSVGADGIIDDFDAYTTPAEPFYQWKLSSDNKDEFISLNTEKTVGNGNKACGQMAYKADMAAAVYTLGLDVKTSDVNAFSFWIKDASYKSDNATFNYLSEVSAHTYLYLSLTSGAIYLYELASTPKVWTEITIPYQAFTLSASSKDETPITSEAINKIAFAFQYKYLTQDGKEYPTYIQSNPVYLDNIKLVKTTLSAAASKVRERTIGPDVTGGSIATIETGEDYASTEDVLASWKYGNDNVANKIELSDDVSSKGGNHSLKMNYQGYAASVYALPLTASSSLAGMKAKGLDIDIKGDGKATVYLNIYLMIGSSVMQIRKNIEQSELSTSWTTYSIGLDKFDDYKNPTSASVNANNINYLYKITIGIVNSDYSASAIYVDNLKFDASLTRTTDTSVVIS